MFDNVEMIEITDTVSGDTYFYEITVADEYPDIVDLHVLLEVVDHQ